MPTETELSVQDDSLPEVDERFHVTNAGAANFVVRHILDSRRYKKRVEEWAASEIRRAEREEAFFVTRFGRELEDWTREQIAALNKRKSLNLPSGMVGFRVEPQKLNCLDESRLLAWCRRHLPRAVKTSESIQKSVVSEHVRETGEVPDGAELGGGEEKFFIR